MGTTKANEIIQGEERQNFKVWNSGRPGEDRHLSGEHSKTTNKTKMIKVAIGELGDSLWKPNKLSFRDNPH